MQNGIAPKKKSVLLNLRCETLQRDISVSQAKNYSQILHMVRQYPGTPFLGLPSSALERWLKHGS